MKTIHDTFDEKQEQEWVKQILESGKQFTAVVTGNTWYAVGIPGYRLCTLGPSNGVDVYPMGLPRFTVISTPIADAIRSKFQ